MKTTFLYTMVAALVFSAGAPLSAQDSASSDAKESEVATVQIMLDRAKFSPGSIDGLWGESSGRTRGALKAFQKENDLEATGELDEKTSEALAQAAGGDEAFTTYQITEEDADSSSFVDEVSDDWKKLSEMDRLSYTSIEEKLGEKFHSAPDYLKKLNPGSAFKAGDSIKVPNIKPFKAPSDADETEVVKGNDDISEVVVSEADQSITIKASDKVIYYAPITPGSNSLPMPSGTIEVAAFDVDPKYYFDPEKIPEADADEKMEIPPGPNSPVGVVWIDLEKDGYGLHGTPEPEKIGYTSSHGCIRMTNWDAMEVAKLVKKGTKIDFQRK